MSVRSVQTAAKPAARISHTRDPAGTERPQGYPSRLLRMAVGHCDDVDLGVALDEVFSQCEAALAGYAPKAGLLMSAWGVDHRALVNAVRARYPGIELAGSSTAGEMSSVLGFREDSVALTLFASDSIDIVTGLGRDLSADPLAAAREAVADASAKTALPPRLCLALAAVGGGGVAVVLDGLRMALGPGIPIIGGGSAPQDPLGPPNAPTSREFVADEVVGDSIAILLFAGPVAFSFGVETGWRGVGPRATVTRASLAAVFEIDGQPAVEFYRRYLGTGQPPLANPLAVFEEPGSTRFYLRTPIGFDDETGAVAFGGAVPVGATVQITMAATDQIVEGAQASIAEALAAFPAGTQPDGALLFSCSIRKLLLGTRAGREVELVRRVLGDGVPVGGFYCLGEIAPMASPDLTRFHNATMVSVLLGSAEPDGAAVS